MSKVNDKIRGESICLSNTYGASKLVKSSFTPVGSDETVAAAVGPPSPSAISVSSVDPDTDPFPIGFWKLYFSPRSKLDHRFSFLSPDRFSIGACAGREKCEYGWEARGSSTTEGADGSITFKIPELEESFSIAQSGATVIDSLDPSRI